MSSLLFIGILSGYFLVLLGISWITSRKADDQSYFLGNKTSPWIAVAFGLIGDSLSGVTFISVPGAVGGNQFTYFQLVLGYLFGYFIIAGILLPLYYKYNLTSIYTYLGQRFGSWAEKTGSFFFLLSRSLGAAARLYLAAGVIQIFIFDALGVPFWLSVSVTIILILVYTMKGGIRTLVWTDTFQSTFLLLGVILSIIAITTQLGWSPGEILNKIVESEHSKMFFWDWKLKSFFPKQFLGGLFIAVAMTGLDQNMMQKNLSIKSLADAQKNLRWFGIVVVLVNLLFLSLGVLLYLFAASKGIAIPEKTDDLFPMLALNHLGAFAAVIFILGLTAATFSSADSVLTTLTTSLYIDILGIEKNNTRGPDQKRRIRNFIHILFAVLLLVIILLFKAFNEKAIIDTVLLIATYTYGPLLGMFAFGIFSKKKPKDIYIPLVCLAAPCLCYVLSTHSVDWFGGYQFSYEILPLNGLLTYFGLSLLPPNKVTNGKNQE